MGRIKQNLFSGRVYNKLFKYNSYLHNVSATNNTDRNFIARGFGNIDDMLVALYR